MIFFIELLSTTYNYWSFKACTSHDKFESLQQETLTATRLEKQEQLGARHIPFSNFYLFTDITIKNREVLCFFPLL